MSAQTIGYFMVLFMEHTINVTTEMMRVGLKVYVDRLPTDASRLGDEDETVRLIYLEMAKAACFEDKQKID